MPTGWYFSQVTGNGQGTTPYRVTLASSGLATAALIPSSPVGLPIWTWALTYGNGTTQQINNAKVAGNEALPTVALSAATGLNNAGRVALTASLLAKFSVSLTVTTSTTLRQVVEAVGRKLTDNPNWIAELMSAG